jgi:hypothetical protein
VVDPKLFGLSKTLDQLFLLEMGNLCLSLDVELLYVATFIMVRDGQKAPLWDASWLDGLRIKLNCSSNL